MKSCFAAFCALILGACASPPVSIPKPPSQRVILLPSENGKPSGVVVKTAGAELLLNMPYAVAEIRGSAVVAGASSAEDIERRYGPLLSAQPKEAKPFTVFFELGTDELTAGSKIAFEQARKAVTTWPGAEVVVIGHTDLVGSDGVNNTLSRKRAQMIANRLASAGVPADRIEVAARGKHEPIIATADGIPEPRNRRVEIKVR